MVVDNKAIELVYGNPKSEPCARLERWELRLLPFRFRIKDVPGATNMADYFSRNTVEGFINSEEDIEHYINTLVDFQLPQSVSLEAVKDATNRDEALNLVKKLVLSEKVDLENQLVKPFVGVRNELSISSEGVVLKGSQIIIPRDFQSHIDAIGHVFSDFLKFFWSVFGPVFWLLLVKFIIAVYY